MAGILDDSESEDSGAIADFLDNLEDEDFIFPEGPSPEVLAKWRSKSL